MKHSFSRIIFFFVINLMPSTVIFSMSSTDSVTPFSEQGPRLITSEDIRQFLNRETLRRNPIHLFRWLRGQTANTLPFINLIQRINHNHERMIPIKLDKLHAALRTQPLFQGPAESTGFQTGFLLLVDGNSDTSVVNFYVIKQRYVVREFVIYSSSKNVMDMYTFLDEFRARYKYVYVINAPALEEREHEQSLIAVNSVNNNQPPSYGWLNHVEKFERLSFLRQNRAILEKTQRFSDVVKDINNILEKKSRAISGNFEAKEFSESLNELSWQTLEALLDLYNGNSEKQIQIYINMVKLFLAHDTVPNAAMLRPFAFIDEKIKDLENLRRMHPDLRKMAKWSYTIEGLYFEHRALNAGSQEQRARYLRSAYHSFSEAISANATKKNHIHAARLILMHGYHPDNVSAKEAHQKAFEHINNIPPQKPLVERETHKSSRPRSTQQKSYLEKSAQPDYLTRNDHLNAIKTYGKETPAFCSHETDSSDFSEADTAIIDDNVSHDEVPENNDIDDLTIDITETLFIPQHPAQGNLPIRSSVLNKAGAPRGSYLIDGRHFQLQDVSGSGLRCFFNAVGVVAADAQQRILEQAEDPAIRLMIANEIASAARNPEQLHQSVKNNLGFEEFENVFAVNDTLDLERSNRLAAQNTHGDLTDLGLLPTYLQNLHHNHDTVLERLRARAFAKNVFVSFVQTQFQKNNAMVALHDLTTNPNSNLTSIDALATVFHFGIKIYQPRNDDLHLAHAFVPQDATEIVYVYHEGFHFQALIPEGSIEQASHDGELEVPSIPNDDIEDSFAVVDNVAANKEDDESRVLQAYNLLLNQGQKTPSINAVHFASKIPYPRVRAVFEEKGLHFSRRAQIGSKKAESVRVDYVQKGKKISWVQFAKKHSVTVMQAQYAVKHNSFQKRTKAKDLIKNPNEASAQTRHAVENPKKRKANHLDREDRNKLPKL